METREDFKPMIDWMLNTQRAGVIEQRFAQVRRSGVVAAMLWLFLGGIGAHRFYLGKPGIGVVYACVAVMSIGFPPLMVVLCLMWVIDGCRLSGQVKRHNAWLKAKIVEEWEPNS